MLNPKTRPEGLNWLNRAATAGDPAAMVELAIAYQKGVGVQRNFQSAAHWLESAIARGYAPAIERLMTVYELGLGIPADPAKAADLKRQLKPKTSQP